MDFDGQRLLPISNEVEVLNGESFRDAVLKPRIEPLLAATTVDELLAALGPAESSLRTLGTVPRFSVTRRPADGSSSNDAAAGADAGAGGRRYPMRTVVDLRNARPANALSLKTVAVDDLYAIRGRWQLSNRFGLGDLVELGASIQPEPYTLAAGSASLTTPMPLGRGLVTVKGFFLNESRRRWAAYDLATHGVSAELRVPWFARLDFLVGAKAVARNIHSITDTASDAVRAAAGSSSLKVSALASLAYAGPHLAARAQIEAAGPPGDARHIKAEAEARGEFALTQREELVLEASGRAGLLVAAGGAGAKPRLCDLFLLGGPDNVAGFARNKLRAHGQQSDDYTGGQAFYSTRVALLSRLPFATPRLRARAQIDAGVLRAQGSTSLHEGAAALLREQAALSTAGGLTYASEQARFEVLYVQRLRGDGEARSGFHVGAEIFAD